MLFLCYFRWRDYPEKLRGHTASALVRWKAEPCQRRPFSDITAALVKNTGKYFGSLGFPVGLDQEDAVKDRDGWSRFTTQRGRASDARRCSAHCCRVRRAPVGMIARPAPRVLRAVSAERVVGESSAVIARDLMKCAQALANDGRSSSAGRALGLAGTTADDHNSLLAPACDSDAHVSAHIIRTPNTRML